MQISRFILIVILFLIMQSHANSDFETISKNLSVLEKIYKEKYPNLIRAFASIDTPQGLMIFTKNKVYFAEHVKVDQPQKNSNKYYSQHGQDKYVNENFFNNKKNGTFVDIGANNGITQSNTYFFEKDLEWAGICIEPIPSVFSKLQKNRKCICIQGCLNNFEGTAQFLEFNASLVSGLVDTMDPRHLERWGHIPHQLITVPCYLPMNIFREYNISHVDYLSIDTEGGEYAILSAIDFSSIDIDIIDVEVRWVDDTRIHNLLTSKGYNFITRIGQDNLYKKTVH